MSSTVPAIAGRREWFGLAVLALPCMLISMDLTVLYLAVPALTQDLQPSSAQLLWITDIYGFMIAGCLITMGTLGDRIGRRRLLMIGGAAFGACSVLAAFSTSAEMLIVSRALLGIAGATLMPSTLSLIRNMFHDERQRTRAMGVWITSFAVGGAIGPLVGGVLLEHFWWGSVLLLAVPVMALLLVAGPVRILPEFRQQSPGRFDLLGAAMSLVSVLAIVYGVKRLAESGFTTVPPLAIVVGVAVGVAFVLRERGLTDGLVDLHLFRNPAFSVSLGLNGLSVFVMLGTSLFVAQYLQLVLDMGPLEAGLWTLPQSVAFIISSTLTPAVAGRLGPVRTVAGGAAIAAAGFAVLALVDGDDGLVPIVVGSFIAGFGLSPVLALATDLVLAAAPAERAGSASAVSETGSELGGALGIAVLGSIGTAVYRSQVTDAVPAGTPPEAAGAARDTLGAAVSSGESLPAGVSGPLLDVARDAFASGLVVASLVSAVLMAAGTVLALTVLGRRSGPQPSAEPEDDGSRSRAQPLMQ